MYARFFDRRPQNRRSGWQFELATSYDRGTRPDGHPNLRTDPHPHEFLRAARGALSDVAATERSRVCRLHWRSVATGGATVRAASSPHRSTAVNCRGTLVVGET